MQCCRNVDECTQLYDNTSDKHENNKECGTKVKRNARLKNNKPHVKHIIFEIQRVQKLNQTHL